MGLKCCNWAYSRKVTPQEPNPAEAAQAASCPGLAGDGARLEPSKKSIWLSHPAFGAEAKAQRSIYLEPIVQASAVEVKKGQVLRECCGRLMLLTGVIATINIIQSILFHVVPPYVPGFGWSALLLSPIPYYVFLVPGLAIVGLGDGLQGFQEQRRKYCVALLLGWACLYGGHVLVRRLSRLTEDNLAMLLMDVGWSCGSVAEAFAVFGAVAAWMATKSLQAVLASLIRGAPTGIYCVALSATLLMNVLVVPVEYLGFIVIAERSILRLYKAFALHYTPCSLPRWLLCYNIHYEIDFQIIASLALASVPGPLVAAQQIVGDWILFVFKYRALSSWPTDLTLAKVDERPCFQRWQKKATLLFSGSSLLFPDHLYAAKSINDMLEGLGQSATMLVTLVFLCIVSITGASEDVYYQEYRHYFLPHGPQGIGYVGLMLLFSLSQDVILQWVVASRGVTTQYFWRDFTQGGRRTLFYALHSGSTSIWIYFAAVSLGWYHSVHCRERGRSLCDRFED